MRFRRISQQWKNPIKSTQLRGFFISQCLNSSRNNAVKNEYMDEYNILPSSF